MKGIQGKIGREYLLTPAASNQEFSMTRW